MNDVVKKVGSKKTKVLTNEVASASTDPQFYAAMSFLPNPDPILRKLGRSQEVYDAIGYDAHVMGEIRSQHGSLLKKEWRLQAGGDSPADQSALELCQAIFNREPDLNVSWSNIIWAIFQSIYKGYSVLEVVWGRDGNHLVPVKVIDKPNRRFVFDSDHNLRLLTKNNMVIGDPVENYKFLLTRHMPTHENPYGVAVFSSCFWPYQFKHNGFRWFSKFMQRFGIPSPIGRYPSGTSPSDQQKLLDALQKMVEDNSAVVPQGTEVDLLETKGSGHHPHSEFINFCNREMSKAITSQTLASEVTEAGSRSTAEIQKERQDDNSEADCEMVQRTMQRLVNWITELNYPSAKAPKWEFYDEKEVSKAEVETLNIAAGLVPLRQDEVYNRLQMTPPTKDDSVVFTGQHETQNAEFSDSDDSHQFKEPRDEIEALSDQGAEAAKPAIKRMLDKIYDFAETAESLEEIEQALPDLLDDVDISEFEESIADTRIISQLLGSDEVGK